MTHQNEPQIGLRIVFGLVVLFAAFGVLILVPGISSTSRTAIAVLFSVLVPHAFLYFFEVRRRA
jgi:hypothetical protein